MLFNSEHKKLRIPFHMDLYQLTLSGQHDRFRSQRSMKMDAS